ncbi:MAG TPA: hypothetical protein VGB50_10525 [Flavobacterium sp.]|jgi:hypothetical protein
MKKLLLLLLFTGSVFAQQQVFNVQQYCVDEKPFKKSQCDISGNEYSFVFLDAGKKEVVFFFTNMKLKYKIVGSAVDPTAPDYTSYTLDDGQNNQILMKVNNRKTKIEFLYPDTRIYLSVGKSTKKEIQ